MEDNTRNVSQMMARERASKRKNIRGSIVARKILLRTILRSITKPRSSVSIVTRRDTILVNAMSPTRYKL
jgi:hypothetical protein